jgi:predicted DNA-binding protein YlxM (UPF0122 family)
MIKLASLTKGKLVELYHKEKKSLEDIAEFYQVSRTAIYNKLKEYGIIQRSKSQARIEAQKQGKLAQQFYDINEDFFNSWSPEMAYVLGLLITDGCISKSGAVSLCINDRELLEKVKVAMGSEHNIVVSKHQKGLHYFHFARENMVKKLIELGVIPKKSLVVKFPEVPGEYMPDFIRGVFDGDGSVFFDKRRPRCPLRAKFMSGSEAFITELQTALEGLGMPKRTIYKQKTRNGWSYMFIYEHKNSVNLFNLLYRNVKNDLYLERKYGRFLEGLEMSTKESLDG